jgi:hypothetical protein
MCITLNVKNMFNPKGGCMKKLLVLALVLSVASMANAALVITPSATTVTVGDTFTMTLGTDTAITAGVGECYWLLVADTSLVSIDYASGAGLSFIDAGITVATDAASNHSDAGLPDGTEGISGGIFLTQLSSVNGTIYTNIQATALTAGTATLMILDGGTSEAIGSPVTLTIKAIPEPITMTLLGLGGLFLRRRSK